MSGRDVLLLATVCGTYVARRAWRVGGPTLLVSRMIREGQDRLVLPAKRRKDGGSTPPLTTTLSVDLSCRNVWDCVWWSVVPSSRIAPL